MLSQFEAERRHWKVIRFSSYGVPIQFSISEFPLNRKIKNEWWGNDKEKMRLVLAQNINFSDKLKLIILQELKDILKLNTKNSFLIMWKLPSWSR